MNTDDGRVRDAVASVASKLRPEQVVALRKVADAGPRGHQTDVWLENRDPNPISLLIIHRTLPGLLTGFSKDEDPSGHRVTLTGFGREVLAVAEASPKPTPPTQEGPR